MRGAQDVDPVDLEGIHDANRPDDLGVVRQVVIYLLAQIDRKLFRVFQFSVPEPLRQNRGRCHHGTRERATPGFIDAGNAADA